jgi:glycosyltransferase involved in cell wall biosynthesis
VFNGARDRYQAAIALAEAGMLERLVTDWYSPLDRSGPRRATAVLPSRLRGLLARRYAPGLPSGRVHAMPVLAAGQALGAMGMDEFDARLGDRAGRLARARGAGVLAYSYYAQAAFAASGEHVPRALFQVQAHPTALRRVLLEEMELAPDARASLAREPELAGDPGRIRGLCEAPLAADLCIAPSSYTRDTLVEAGVAPSRVHVVPYGVDLGQFRPAAPPRGGPFRVLFAGQLAQRKGLKYLLEAWRRLALPGAELVLVGRGIVDRALLSGYEGLFRTEMDVHSRDRMRDLYGEADVFCMPSLVESFGLVYLEALACGTPVIGTRSTGAPDLVREGRDGFLVDVRDVEGLMERLAWCHAHRGVLRDMRAEARSRAEEFTWDRFRAGVVRAAREARGIAHRRLTPTTATLR